jgi:glucosamine kinase
LTQHLFIGVDGGATKSIVRIEDEAGCLLGQETSGPANIRISVDQAWQSINAALGRLLQPLAISFDEKKYSFHAGMGLAGCEVKEAHDAYLNRPHRFKTLVVASDGYTACLGAHGGNDGAIIIAGTGTVGYQIQTGQTAKVGGFGFPHDDEGGGAWLGLEAMKVTLRWLDGRQPLSGLATAVYDYFMRDQARLLSWANQANSTAFAELAPLVIQQVQAGDGVALKLIQQAAQAIDEIGFALHAAQSEHTRPLPCALAGGVAIFLEPFLGPTLRSRLHACQATPAAGAIIFVRNHLAGIKLI